LSTGLAELITDRGLLASRQRALIEPRSFGVGEGGGLLGHARFAIATSPVGGGTSSIQAALGSDEGQAEPPSSGSCGCQVFGTLLHLLSPLLARRKAAVLLLTAKAWRTAEVAPAEW